MSLEKIIIKTVSLDTSTKRVEIAAIYEGTATLIKDILTISDIHIALSFVWTRSQEFQFDISASFSIGDAPIHVNLIRNKEGNDFTRIYKSEIVIAKTIFLQLPPQLSLWIITSITNFKLKVYQTS